MADRQEWKGQRFKKKHVRNVNIVSHNTMESIFLNLVHLNDKNLFSMRNGEVYMAGLF